MLDNAWSTFKWIFYADSGRKPWMLETRSSDACIMCTVSFAAFTDMMLYGVIIPVIPYALVTEFGVAESDVQRWNSISVFVYAAGLLFAGPIFGILADHYRSRRTFMLVGLISLIVATLIICLAKSVGVFIFGRLIQGISGGAVWTVGLALLSDSFPDEHIGKVMGILGGALSLGVCLGPLIGGIVFSRAGYFAVFAVVFSVVGFDILMRLFMLEKKDLIKYQNSGSVEHVLIDATVENVTGDEETIIAVPGATGGASEQFSYSKKFRLPGMFRLLSNWRVLNVLFLTTIMAWIMAALESTLPYHAEQLFNYSSLGSGLLFLPLSITSLTGPLIGYWIDKTSPRWPLCAGFVITCPFVILMRVPNSDDLRQIVLMFALLGLLGLAMAALNTATMAEISACVTAAEAQKPGVFGAGGGYAQAFGLFNFAYSAGSVIGPLEGGFLVDNKGWDTMTWSLGLIAGITAVPALLFTSGYLFSAKNSIEVVTQNAQGSNAIDGQTDEAIALGETIELRHMASAELMG
ncbi:major facilitator superfamily domain-containing protein [Limtongia smithiae]|uniref:major facilitator superfamily domain-containing protein n=1 Tax=Limtongia smithiae TaxID=1125753 RepID=UPI0034CEAE1E